MKNWDVLIIRFLPFILFIIYGMNVWSAISDKEPFLSYELHGNSVLYAASLFAISLANKRYHCIWNRAMYVFLIVIPIFNYLDGHFVFFEDVDAYLWVVSATSIFTALVTAYLAIKHFVTMSKKRMNNGN